MRDILWIVVHGTGAPISQTTDSIRAHWVNVNGWKLPGYHELISGDGSVELLLDISIPSNGVKGFNKNALHICCKGGVDEKGNPIDNRTPEQKKSLEARIRYYKKIFPNAVVLGHRDFSTDQNGNGIIDRWEFIKSCPGYDVRDWLKLVGLESVVRPKDMIYKLNFPLIKDDFVLEIQKALEKRGARIDLDRVFGKQTSDALIAFQTKNKIKPTGIADNFTVSMLGIR